MVDRDAYADTAADRHTGYFSGDYVWIGYYDASGKLQNGDLEVGGGVGVDAVVSHVDIEISGYGSGYSD